MLLEKPQVRSVKTEYQKRQREEKSLENTDREKHKVYFLVPTFRSALFMSIFGEPWSCLFL